MPKAKTKKDAGVRAVLPKPAKPFFQPFGDLGAKVGKKPVEPGEASKPAKTPPPVPVPPKAEPAQSEAETFAIHMAGVKALEAGRSRIPKTSSQLEQAPRVPLGDPDAAARAKLGGLVAEGLRFEVSDDGRFIDGRRVDVDPREIRRLRRGEYSIDGRLDLHGMTAGEAREAVEAFVRKRRSEGDKVLAIVHGKGSHSPRGQGVLRGEIAAWLSQGRIGRDVQAFASAPDEEGGTGAVLVLLAR